MDIRGGGVLGCCVMIETLYVIVIQIRNANCIVILLYCYIIELYL